MKENRGQHWKKDQMEIKKSMTRSMYKITKSYKCKNAKYFPRKGERVSQWLALPLSSALNPGSNPGPGDNFSLSPRGSEVT